MDQTKPVDIPLSTRQKLEQIPDVPQEITQDEIIELMISKGLNIDKFVDAIVAVNGIVGVGYITLEEMFTAVIRDRMKKTSRSYESFMNT